MKLLLYAFELYLLFAPNAYYIPALETHNAFVLVAFVLLNITGIISARYLFNSIKTLFKRHT